MRDEKGIDEKIIVVPAAEVDPCLDHIVELEDIPEVSRKAIDHFFRHYKSNEVGKWSMVEGFAGREHAEKLISDYQQAYLNRYESGSLISLTE